VYCRQAKYPVLVVLTSHKFTRIHSVARVAKLADARDLKSRVLNRTYRFNSGPGHQ
jgi:hypothetical protein